MIYQDKKPKKPKTGSGGGLKQPTGQVNRNAKNMNRKEKSCASAYHANRKKR